MKTNEEIIKENIIYILKYTSNNDPVLKNLLRINTAIEEIITKKEMK